MLDTWFSSWLFPISTLGWPDKSSAALAAFYPTDDLVTAPEILFFWVSRMIMARLRVHGRAAVSHRLSARNRARHESREDVQVARQRHRSARRRRAVRRRRAALYRDCGHGHGRGSRCSIHRDLERSFAPGRNFATKLWNIGRFLLANVGTTPVRSVDELRDDELTLADRWILGRLNARFCECDAALGPARPEKGKWRRGRALLRVAAQRIRGGRAAIRLG